MTTRVFQKFDPSAKRGTAKACEVCDKSFSVLLMDYEHQCKRCLRAICKQCGKTKRDVYKPGFAKTPHRLCSICTKQSDFLIDYIQCNQLKFGEDSPIAKKWLAKLPDQIEQQGMDDGDSNKDALTFQLFTEVWDAYNYSMREFVGLLTFDKNQKQVYKLIKQVYDELLGHGYKQKLEHVLFLIVFLLCFSSTKKCLKLLEHLITLRQTVTDSKQLMQLYLKALRLEEAEVKQITDYLSFKIKQFVGTLSVNVLTVECSIHLISRILERSKIEEAHMLFALAVEDNMKTLVKNKNSKLDCDFELVRNSKLEKYMQKYKQISTTKIGQFIKEKQKKTLKGTNQQSSEKQGSESIFSESPNKNVDMQDKVSIKTRSIRDEPLLKQCTDETRKTQKQFIVPKFSDQITLQEYSFSSHQCYECEKNIKRIEDLQSKLKLKEKEIQNLNFKLNFKRKQSTDSFNRDRTSTYEMIKESEEVSRLEREILQKSDQSNTMFEEMSRAKKQNAILKSRIEELETTNRILKNNLSVESAVSVKSSSLDFTQQEENNRAFETLKKALDNKNRHLEEVVKKNKLLNYQIQQMQREYSIKKPEANIGTKEELFKKVEELSLKVNEEQAQKLRLSEELFQMKQLLGEYIDQTQPTDQKKEVNPTSANKQCSIF